MNIGSLPGIKDNLMKFPSSCLFGGPDGFKSPSEAGFRLIYLLYKQTLLAFGMSTHSLISKAPQKRGCWCFVAYFTYILCGHKRLELLTSTVNGCILSILIATLFGYLKKQPHIRGCLHLLGVSACIFCGRTGTRTPDLYCVIVAL